jgi:hypothetical protein
MYIVGTKISINELVCGGRVRKKGEIQARYKKYFKL